MKKLKLLLSMLTMLFGSTIFPAESGEFDVVEAELSDIVDLDKLKAFEEAYNGTEPLNLGYLHPNSRDQMKNHLEAAQLLAAHVKNGHYSRSCSVDYVCGRPIKQSFGKVFKKHPCSLFTKQYLALMSPHLSKTLAPTIECCIRRDKKIKQAESFVVDPSLDYTVRFSPYNATPDKDMSPKEAFDKLQGSAQRERETGEEHSSFAFIKLSYDKPAPSEPTGVLGRLASLWQKPKPIEKEKVEFALPLQAAAQFLNRFTKKQDHEPLK